jgi:hypothetical protein
VVPSGGRKVKFIVPDVCLFAGLDWGGLPRKETTAALFKCWGPKPLCLVLSMIGIMRNCLLTNDKHNFSNWHGVDLLAVLDLFGMEMRGKYLQCPQCQIVAQISSLTLQGS